MTRLLLELLRVPPEPHPPAGSPESIRVFRASPNLYYWNLFYWALLQGIVLVAALVLHLVVNIRAYDQMPAWLQIGWNTFETLAAALLLAGLLIGFYKQRLDYEMRWYIVTDRSLRIRSGIWSVQEMTMTFANVQKIGVSQGPLQKILGIANVEVSSAGGGSAEPGKKSGTDRHTAKFEGVATAREIRDLIQERVRRYRDAGLGDSAHEEHSADVDNDPLQAAQALLAEARLLRQAIGR